MIKIYNMDVMKALKKMPDKSVDMQITSPPYWALRNYGVDGQLGLESTFDEYIKNASGLKTIAFCATVEHSKRLENFFNKMGVRACSVNGKTPKAWRSRIINDFRNSKYEIIFVRDLFNEGIDVPNVSCVLFLRPTDSSIIFSQQLGRGLRNFNGKEKLLALDFTGNAINSHLSLNVLGELIGKDLIGNIKKHHFEGEYKKQNKELIFFNYECSVRLNKRKVNLIKDLKYNGLIPKERIIDEYFNIKKMLKKRLTYAEFLDNSTMCIEPIKRVWGSWTNFLQSIGEDAHKNTISKNLTNEDLFKEYFKLKEKFGRRPVSNDFCYKNKKSVFSEKLIRNRFGNFTNFLKAMKIINK